ncbi:hypothetical protein [Streptomyces sp. NPDC046862]|uniref:hypothetical protein n=1 Tax=Streptomyces sp. NPDC046862 TaxID=3154603 RepID=UPI003454258E
MFNSKKIAAAAAAGVLGGFALVGVGTAQAFAADGPGKCVDDGQGHVRCEQTSRYKLTTDKAGNVQVTHNATQTCPTSQSEVTCVNSVVIPGGKN